MENEKNGKPGKATDADIYDETEMRIPRRLSLLLSFLLTSYSIL